MTRSTTSTRCGRRRHSPTAWGIVHVEAVLHNDPERWLNRVLGAHLLIGRWLGDYYDIAHLAVTVVVLVACGGVIRSGTGCCAMLSSAST